MVAHAHFSKVSRELHRMWTSGHLLDAEIETKDSPVQVHKIILILFSAHWRDTLSKGDNSRANISATAFSSTDIEQFLSFLYTGDLEGTPVNKALEIIRNLKLDLTVDKKIRKKTSSKGASGLSDIELELKYLRNLKFEIEFSKLYKSIGYSDVKIATGKHIHDCQRVILAAFSPYFEVMFSSGMRETQEQTVSLKGVQTEIFKHIVSFVYTGRLSISTNNAQALLCTAVYLQIRSLQSTCEEFLLNHMDTGNCIDIWKLGEAYNCDNLKEGAFDFVVDHFSQLSTSELTDIDIESFSSLIKADHLSVTDETKVLDHVLNWVGKDATRERHLEGLMASVRVPLLPPTCIASAVANPVVARNANVRKLLETVGQDVMSENILALVPRKEKSFIVLKSSSVADGLEVSCYSLRRDKWYSLKPKRSFVGGSGFACCVSGSDVYVSGGTAQPTAVISFSIDSNTWTRCPDMLEGRHCHAIESVSSSVYVVGGAGMPSATDLFPVVTSVEKFDTCQQQWSHVGQLAIPTSDSASAVVNGRIYILGGTIGVDTRMFSKEVQCYDTLTDTCTVLYPHLPITVSMAVAVGKKNNIYIACPRGEVISYNDDCSTAVLGHLHRSSMMGYGTLYHDGAVYMLGGVSPASESDAIFKFDLNHKTTMLEKTKLPFKKQSNQYYASVAYISI